MIGATILLAMAAQGGTAVETAYEALQSQPKAEVMVMGSFHFHHNDAFDGLSEPRQRELEAITDRLATYDFTVVAMECTAELEEQQNAKLAAMKAGNAELDENENDQIGVRLAAKLGLDRVECIDPPFPPTPNFDDAGDWDAIIAYGEERGETAHFGKWMPLIETYFAEATRIQTEEPLPDSLDFSNTIAADYSESRMLLLEAAIGVDGSWVGPDWLGRFEGRNARMFARINRASQPEDRVFVLVGTAHKRPLERYFNNSFEFDVIDVPRFSKEDPDA